MTDLERRMLEYATAGIDTDLLRAAMGFLSESDGSEVIRYTRHCAREELDRRNALPAGAGING